MNNFHISKAVGQEATNKPSDCKLIRALLNVYHRKKGKEELKIEGKSDQEMINAIKAFQKDKVGMNQPDGRVDPGAGTWRKLEQSLKSTRTKKQVKRPQIGGFTFDVEGQEGGPYHSRILHVPSPDSGLTIGRGYDMKKRSRPEIKTDLKKAGVKAEFAKTISNAAGKHGSQARAVIINQDLMDFEITPEQQLELFNLIIENYIEKAKRIATEKSTEKQYGQTDWDKLDARIKDILVDMAYRGDYIDETIKIVQEHVADNNLNKFKKAMNSKSKWQSATNIPPHRFNRRAEYLESSN